MAGSTSFSFGTAFTAEGVRFSLYAPRVQDVTLCLEGPLAHRVSMTRDTQGRFSVLVPSVQAGARYRFQLGDERTLYPDPASRFQPEGPHGPSEVVDPHAYVWHDHAHPGVELAGQVIYELHVGTFTPEGTFQSARAQLAALADTGITLLELMPVAAFPGAFGWGYDGVNLFAPSQLYGSPEDFRAFVDEAHRLGIGVILDVVYNHLGPDGNFMTRFSDTFFSSKGTDWGQAINFDEAGSEWVRAFYCANARAWIEEYHLDGLRLDATQDIHDSSGTHIIAEIVSAARAAAGPRTILIVAENEPQHTRLVRSAQAGGFGCDALWNDDFHHTALVAATGRREAYYSDTLGTPQELISAIKWGYLYQGQYYTWQKQKRGTPGLTLPAPHFVLYLQNHDQIANSARGLRLHALTSPGRCRALKALLLLAPGTPMLFQGEEFDASSPFFYFADHHSELAPAISAGRAKFLAQFPSMDNDAVRNMLAPPHARDTFERSKLDPGERESHGAALAMTRDLLRLRKTDATFRAQSAQRVHGSVLGAEAFALRYFGEAGDDRLLLVNLGADVDLVHAAEPLLAPPEGRAWKIAFSTEDPRYGGLGTPALAAHPHLHLHGHSAVVLSVEDEET